MSITLINPFSFNDVVVNENNAAGIQEVIYYAESRFRVILDVISRADIEKKIWTEKLLQRELVGTRQFFIHVS